MPALTTAIKVSIFLQRPGDTTAHRNLELTLNMVFPSIGVSWRASQENFVKKIDAISES
ncbi:MAG: hypothetical protein WKG06_27975 [Segetibacter sp.]